MHQVRTRRYPRRIVIGYDPKVDPTVWVRALERTLYPSVHALVTPESPKIPALMAISAGIFGDSGVTRAWTEG